MSVSALTSPSSEWRHRVSTAVPQPDTNFLLMFSTFSRAAFTCACRANTRFRHWMENFRATLGVVGPDEGPVCGQQDRHPSRCTDVASRSLPAVSSRPRGLQGA